MSSSDPRDSMFEFDSPRNSKGLSGKIVLSAIVVLLFVVILIICLYLDLNAHSYLLRARRRHNTRRSPHRRTTQLVFYVDPSNPNAAAAANVSSRGLDEKVLKSLPLFVYSAETHPDLIECAVCLSEFEENETGRVLPNCKHSFHVECIDMWFHSHSTCPLCRSPVDAPVPKNAAVKTGPSSVESASRSAELCTTCQHEEEVGGGGAASTSSFGRPRKPVELMGVTVEVPPRRMNSNFEDESAPESPSLQAFRSPMSRMLSFKRILNRERRAPVSPAASCAESVPELDVERGREETQ